MFDREFDIDTNPDDESYEDIFGDNEAADARAYATDISADDVAEILFS